MADRSPLAAASAPAACDASVTWHRVQAGSLRMPAACVSGSLAKIHKKRWRAVVSDTTQTRRILNLCFWCLPRPRAGLALPAPSGLTRDYTRLHCAIRVASFTRQESHHSFAILPGLVTEIGSSRSGVLRGAAQNPAGRPAVFVGGSDWILPGMGRVHTTPQKQSLPTPITDAERR